MLPPSGSSRARASRARDASHSKRRARRLGVPFCLALASCSGAEQATPGAETVAPAAAPLAVEIAAERAATAPQPEGPSARDRAIAERRAAEESERARLEASRAAFERAYPLHGVSFHFLARVYERPTYDSRPIGYMRRGSRFRAGERVPGRGCAQGWHEVPGGGYVCRGDGYKVGRQPQSFEPSPQPPSLEDALPYAYAFTPRTSVAQFWHLPSELEERTVAGILSAIEAAEAAPRTAPAVPPEAVAEAADVEAPPPPGQSPAGEESADPHDDAEETAAAAAEGEAKAGDAVAAAAPATPPADPLALPDYVRMRMRRGFYLSVDGRESDGARRFVRTVRGGYVREDALTPNVPPSHRGVVLGGAYRLPIAFVHLGGAHRLRRDPSTGQLRPNGQFERHTPLVLADTLERAGTRYFVTPRGDVVRETGVRVASVRERPEGVGPTERWVHVRLSQQTLVAYEGDRPVFATTVSTGRPGFETPTGLFRIESKHVSTTMDDLHDPESPYSIEDVPWTMYFTGNFALHGAFWHDSFGRVRSHGCVNLAPADARFLFQWTEPMLPASWHGVFARAGEPGTIVLIER